jgi:hypothetical protein
LSASCRREKGKEGDSDYNGYLYYTLEVEIPTNGAFV